MSNCIRPAALKIQLAILTATRNGLISGRRRLLTQIQRLESILATARQAAWDLCNQAAAVLQAKGGIERGRWAYHRGVYDLCYRALGWLQVAARPALIWYQRERIPDYYRRWY